MGNGIHLSRKPEQAFRLQREPFRKKSALDMNKDRPPAWRGFPPARAALGAGRRHLTSGRDLHVDRPVPAAGAP